MNRSARVHAALCLLAVAGASIAPAAANEPAPAAIADTPFMQEYRDAFLRPPGGELADIRALAVDRAGRIWVAARGGVGYFDAGAWHTPGGAPLDGPAYDVAIDAKGIVWIGAWNGLYRVIDEALERVDAVEGPISAIGVSPRRLIAAGPRGFWERSAGAAADDAAWRPLDIAVPRRVRDILIADDAVWFATGVGAYRVTNGEVRRFATADELASSDAHTLAQDEKGRVWIGTSGGIDLYDGPQRVGGYRGADGLPASLVSGLVFDAQGRLWAATERGAARFDGTEWRVRHSERWLPSDLVRAIAFDADGHALIGTSAGIARLASRPMTLAEKAEHYRQIVRTRHVRPPGLVERCDFRTPGDTSTYYAVDTDNDGMYTGLYVATEAYRYAVTGDATAGEHARDAYRAMEFLQTVTGTRGFVARTVIPADWTSMADANRTHTPQEIAEMLVDDPREKAVDVRWRPSRDGEWLWKGDTSSDEMTGHFFAYAIYYDLVADEEEKERVRAHVVRIIDYLIEGGYDLVDIDGQPTRWGVWSPQRLNGDPAWRLDRGVNSVELLSYLKTAHHMTGDEKYERAAQELLEEHDYAANVRDPQQLDPGSFTYIDTQLLALAYRGLLAYEKDPVRRENYVVGVERWFAPVRRDHSPLYGFVYGKVTGREFGAAECVEFLRQAPWDMIDWSVENSQREDVALVRRPTIEHWQTSKLLPPDERRVGKWDGNPYTANGGAGGRSESSTVYWLLPYWIGRYYGYIAPPGGGERVERGE